MEKPTRRDDDASGFAGTSDSAVYDFHLDAVQFVPDLLRNESAHKAEAAVAHETASSLLFYSNLCLTIPSILLLPFLGTWGDKFGRKFPAILPAVGALLSAVNYAICSGISSTPVELLLLSNFFQGITGGFTGCIMAVSSWASHISSLKVRTSRLGCLEFANLLGTSIAPAIGGAIASATYGGYPLAFALAGSLNIILTLYVIFFLQEPERQHEHKGGIRQNCRTMWSLEFLKDMYGLLRWIYIEQRARLCIVVAAFALMCTWTLSTGTNEIRYLYIRTLNLNWETLEYNLFSAEDAFIRGLTLITVLPLLKMLFHVRDFIIIVLGFISKIAMFIIYATSVNSVMIFLAVVAGFLAAAVSACGRSICSRNIHRDDQGKLFGILGILENLSSLLGSLIFQNVYTATREWYPGFSYALAAGLLVIPGSVIMFCYRTLREYDARAENEHSALIDEEQFVDDPVSAASVEDLDFEPSRTASVTV
ncbi:proton-coupled folate transporter-like isoform X2 [Paramacrobiotus metropolitanus]|uniref:proton-coupled folate transporter-like isoform X2 n=1 Tax=Paramacrobiotus metropolitanus TaxID=2943436 RepID=UPI002445DCF7|nr:proton-coupled folate transporter-like isoform X2 [Paramacrobiotus metropolitanus]